jgi:hypothetical protein
MSISAAEDCMVANNPAAVLTAGYHLSLADARGHDSAANEFVAR